MTGLRRSLAAVGLTAATMGLPAMVAQAGTLDPLQSQQAGVVVFEQVGYGGASASLGPGNRSAPFGAIQSIQVVEGYSAQVCTGSRGGGTCLAIAGSTRDLGTLVDDPVTWVKVQPQSPPPTTTTTTTTTIATTTTTIRPATTTAPPAPPTTAPRTTTTATTQPSRTSTIGSPATTVVLDRPDRPATTSPSATTTSPDRDDGDIPEGPTTTTPAPGTTTATTASETTTTSTPSTTTTTGSVADDVSAAGPPSPGPSLPATVVPTDGADRGWRLPTIAAVSIGALALFTLLLVGRLQLWWGADPPLQPPERGGS